MFSEARGLIKAWKEIEPHQFLKECFELEISLIEGFLEIMEEIAGDDMPEIDQDAKGLYVSAFRFLNE
ncbi:MAG: hypothetical protein ACTSXQ_01160 [Alphaproteobacteria bacterium]